MPGPGPPLRGAGAPAVRSRVRALPGAGQDRGRPLPALRRSWLGAPSTKEYHLRIPPGTQDGARFRIMGEGGEGFQNGPRGTC